MQVLAVAVLFVLLGGCAGAPTPLTPTQPGPAVTLVRRPSATPSGSATATRGPTITPAGTLLNTNPDGRKALLGGLKDQSLGPLSVNGVPEGNWQNPAVFVLTDTNGTSYPVMVGFYDSAQGAYHRCGAVIHYNMPDYHIVSIAPDVEAAVSPRGRFLAALRFRNLCLDISELQAPTVGPGTIVPTPVRPTNEQLEAVLRDFYDKFLKQIP
jgi:hypothetical protein